MLAMAITRLRLAGLMALALVKFLFSDDTLNTHPVRLDANGKLLSWVQPQEMVYDRIMRLAWDALSAAWSNSTVVSVSLSLEYHQQHCELPLDGESLSSRSDKIHQRQQAPNPEHRARLAFQVYGWKS